jgi:AraC-like DNA-binding protein
MVHVPTMTATVIPHVLRAARRAGVEPASIVARLGLTPSLTFADRVPLSLIADFWESMMRAVPGDPWFPIRAAAIPEHEELSLLTMFCRAQETLGEALRSVARYSLLVTDAFLISTQVRGDRVVLAFDTPAAIERLGVRCQMEFLVCDTVGCIEHATGGVRPLEVAFAHSRRVTGGVPPWPAGAQLRYGASRTGIVYARSAWNARLTGAKPELARALRPQLDAMLLAAEGRMTTTDRVGMVLAELLHSGRPSGQRAARRLSMGWRTLQRRLAGAGTTFRGLLDDTRFRLARGWLGNTPIKIVAGRLGYADERAFCRAFRRWAGTSPMHYLRESGRERRVRTAPQKSGRDD